MTNALYRIARDEGREIGPDMLYVTRLGLEFWPGRAASDNHLAVVEVDLSVARTIANVIPGAFVVNADGGKVL